MATESEPQDASGSAAPKSKKATASKGKKPQVSKRSKKGTGAESNKKSKATSSALATAQQLDLPSDPVKRRQIEMLNTLSTSLTTSIASLLVSGFDQNAMKSLLDGITASVATMHAISEPEDATGAFVRFPSLPPELRRMIWKFALPGPRVVEVTHIAASGKKLLKLRLSCDMPAMVHTCAESRQVVFEKYRVKIAMYDGDCGWIDPNDDIIYFPGGHEFIVESEGFSADALESIQNIAVDDRCSWYDDGFDPPFDFHLFCSLEKIMINQMKPDLYFDSDEEYFNVYHRGRFHKEHYEPSLVDIDLKPRGFQDVAYLEMVEDYLYEMEFELMKEIMENEKDEADDWASELSIPEVLIVDVERKERKPCRKYWGF